MDAVYVDVTTAKGGQRYFTADPAFVDFFFSLV